MYLQVVFLEGVLATAPHRERQAHLGTDGPVSGRAGPSWDRRDSQARFGRGRPASGRTGPPRDMPATRPCSRKLPPRGGAAADVLKARDDSGLDVVRGGLVSELGLRVEVLGFGVSSFSFRGSGV